MKKKRKTRGDLLIYKVAKRLQDERAVAMRCVAAVLSPHNENVKRGDLVAAINDLAQVKVTAMENYNELLAEVRKICPELADRLT